MTATQGEIDNLLHYVPIVIRAPDLSKWERDFCISIAGRLKRGAFTPSEKQIGVLRRIVTDFQSAMRDDSLVERGS